MIESSQIPLAMQPSRARRNPQIDERRFLRFPLYLPVQLQLPNGLRIQTHTRDLSLGDSFVIYFNPLPEGVQVALQLPCRHFQSSDALIPGRTVRRDDRGMAIRFIDPSGEAGRAIEGLLAQYF